MPRPRTLHALAFCVAICLQVRQSRQTEKMNRRLSRPGMSTRKSTAK